MKILCLYLCDYSDRNDYYLSLMPYGITSIAAFLEKDGHEITLANFSSYGFAKAVKVSLDLNPDAVAISIFSFNRNESFRYIRELKKRNKKIVVIAGGQHPTFLSDLIISKYPEIDFIVSGEGEYAVKKLIDKSFKINERVIASERISDINNIPYGSLFSGQTIGVNPNEQYKYIITSRGCPSNCTYCSSPYFWNRKVTYRSPENIIEELKHIHKKFGIIYFSIRDDNFTLSKKRVMEFCSLLQKSGLFMMWNCQARVDTIDEEMLVTMKKCGLEHIQFGVESGSERILKLYDKHITVNKIKKASELTRRTGIYLSYYLMTGMTGETESDFKDTKKLLSETLPHDVIISPVAYYPGTGIYSNSLNNGKIDNNVWFESDENGLYLSNSAKNETLINNLLKYSAKISFKAKYKKNDFKIHRQTTGNECWMNYILEGDFYSEEFNIEKAIFCFNKLISEYPENIWGYLRKAELISDHSPNDAIKLFRKASEIVPEYFGTWFRLAQLYYQSGNIKESEFTIRRALKLNPDEPEIKLFSRKITRKSSDIRK